MTIKNYKKAQNQIGIAIIVMAILLLLGGIFVDDGGISKTDYIKNKNSNLNQEYPEETYLFYLNDTEIGRQSKVTESFPNVEIGAREENNIIYMENNFKIKSNPFTKTVYSFQTGFNEPENVKKLLLYFTLDRVSGDQDLIIKVNDKIYYQNQARSNEIPLIINYKPNENNSNIKITFEIDKPAWYQLFNWNSFEIKELKVMENIQDKSNNIKEFDFQVDKDFLERVELNLVTDCQNTGDAIKPVKIEVNEFNIADFTPDCQSRYNTITREIPMNILNSKQNEIKIKTDGYYNIAYSLNKIYFNDKETYKFIISNFNDVIDVVIYGDFDKEVIDLRINSQTISLKRDEVKSIIPYLRFGNNEIKFLTKPVAIEEFIIEKNEFLY